MGESFVLMIISGLARPWARGSLIANFSGSHFDARGMQECPSISIYSECPAWVIEYAKGKYPHISQLNYKLEDS
jgi:hypothetical protein